MTSGGAPQREIEVTAPGAPGPLRFARTVRIGRASTNDIVLDDDQVSAEHLELRPSDDGWTIVDLNSTNGTWIDGVPLSHAGATDSTSVRLGPNGPELHLSVLGHTLRGDTREVDAREIVDRLIATRPPTGMSRMTAMIRAAFLQRLEQEAASLFRRIRNLRAAVGLLVVLSVGAGAFAMWQTRRVNALRDAAGDVFSTLKSLELDVLRLEAAAGPDTAFANRIARLAAQYDDMVKTLGIYSSRTPADVQLIYRTVHQLGESEANVPQGFVDEVRRYVKRWQSDELITAFTRAAAQNLGPRIGDIFSAHHVPREFFWLAMQESRFDTRAIGPATRFGVPKGLWQIIPPTAQAYGLRLGPLRAVRQFDPLDERHDVVKATTAAARYVEDMFKADAQASGILVIAAYNMGEPRIRTLINSLPQSPAQRNFWVLLKAHKREIPAETYDYVFRVVSAAVIGANPRLFGYDLDPPLAAADSTRE